jgi:hypothetical protein
MKASKFVAQAKKKYGAKFAVEDGNLVVLNRPQLPSFLQLAIAGHQEQLVDWLVERVDVELTVRQCQRDLEALGLVRMEHNEWTHPLGDEGLEELLAGLLDPSKRGGWH